MGKLFNAFVEKAKSKLGDIKNPKEKIDKKKFKVPNEEFEEQVVLPNNDEALDKLEEDFSNFDDYGNNFYDDPVSLYPAQKPESFHFFILENQYQDLERAIRGVKDVWNKEKQQWVIKRKDKHCFTDEESEDIVRTAQSHLSSDIKLAVFNKEEYPILLNSIYDQLWTLFKSIMDYRFGRFGTLTKQLEMKQQAVNIFNMLMMRIKANYSRAIEGRENNATHEGIKGQESLNQTERRGFPREYT